MCVAQKDQTRASTAFGVFNAMIGYEEFQNKQNNLENKKILIKGYGKVGADWLNFVKILAPRLNCRF